ncbi:septal ring lytic transglycosylase RlpA family protein [Gammaproteobacteria bacterium]|nr:septal ring lytic transglycosylase RlpA family protein [Gammaproteobacteria bacterium]
MAGAEEGTASYYADSLDGNPTASGELYNRKAMTAAHRTLPFGTTVKVTNLSNDKSVVVRINDRGPHTKNRVIDLSGAAAEKLGLLDSGTARVRIEQK